MAAQTTPHRPDATLDPDRTRYVDAPHGPDHVIDQHWARYTPAEHDRWDRLYARAIEVLTPRACPEFLRALEILRLSESGVPDMAALSDRLEPLTGWRVVPVRELVPDAVFFEHLANRRFPAGAFLRAEAEMDYLEEPDIFHDVFGHAPLLATPAYADFMQAYGAGGLQALSLGRLENLARLYWHTIEFGLVRSDQGLKLFGAGLMSSAAEARFALEDPAPNRLAFDLERVMRTRYAIDAFQPTYFVIDSVEQLRADCAVDFAELYARLADGVAFEPGALRPGDRPIGATPNPSHRASA